MTESPQIQANAENCDRQLALYEAIRFQISESFFSRIQIDEDELLHVLFDKLVDKFLPPFGSEKLTELLCKEIRHTIRDFKLAKRTGIDIDEFDLNDGPSYDDRKKDFETEFEEIFERFCKSCDEPQRTVYKQFRAVPQKELAKVAGILRDDVRLFLKTLPKKFKDFLKNYRD